MYLFFSCINGRSYSTALQTKAVSLQRQLKKKNYTIHMSSFLSLLWKFTSSLQRSLFSTVQPFLTSVGLFPFFICFNRWFSTFCNDTYDTTQMGTFTSYFVLCLQTIFAIGGLGKNKNINGTVRNKIRELKS